MTIKSLFGNRAVYVAMMDIRMDMVVTRAAYRIPQDNLLYIIKNQTTCTQKTCYRLFSYKQNLK